MPQHLTLIKLFVLDGTATSSPFQAVTLKYRFSPSRTHGKRQGKSPQTVLQPAVPSGDSYRHEEGDGQIATRESADSTGESASAEAT